MASDCNSAVRRAGQKVPLLDEMSARADFALVDEAADM